MCGIPPGDGGGGAAGGVDTPSASPKSPSDRVLTAHDFRYDKTNLPRYPDSVTAMASAISYPPGDRTDIYGTSSGIVTSSSFDSHAGGSAAQPGSAASAAAPPEKLKISIFRPPAGSRADTGVMIIQKGDQPVQAFMQTNVKP